MARHLGYAGESLHMTPASENSEGWMYLCTLLVYDCGLCLDACTGCAELSPRYQQTWRDEHIKQWYMLQHPITGKSFRHSSQHSLIHDLWHDPLQHPSLWIGDRWIWLMNCLLDVNWLDCHIQRVEFNGSISHWSPDPHGHQHQVVSHRGLYWEYLKICLISSSMI